MGYKENKMRTKKLLFYLLAGILGGCIPVMSVNPFYTESDILFEESLLGTWIDDPNSPETTWEFSREDDPNTAYKLVFSDEEGRKGSFIAHLVKLQDVLFLDVFPAEMPWETEDSNDLEFVYNSFFLIPAHTLLKVDSFEPQLILRLTVEDDMKKLLEEHPGEIEYHSLGDRTILTSSTEELQTFVLKYADDERLFPGKVELIRK